MTIDAATRSVKDVQSKVVDAIELADKMLGAGPQTDTILEAAIGGLGCVEVLLTELLDRLRAAREAGKDHAP